MEKVLRQMIWEINKKQQELEEECAVLNELLKPWPLQRNETSQIQPQIDASQMKESDKKEENLSKEEQETLLTVEKLLHKAQLTRQVKTKVHVEPQLSNFTRESNTEQTPPHCLDVEEQTHRTEKAITNTPVNDGRPTHGDHLKRNSDRQIVDVKSYTSVDKTVSSKTKSQSHKSVSQGRRPSRPASGKNGYVPAHVSAPFKTEHLNVRTRRKPQTGYVSRNSTTKPKADSGVSRASSYNTLPAIKQADDINNSKLEDMSVPSDEGLSSSARDDLAVAQCEHLTDSQCCSRLKTGGMETIMAEGSTSSSSVYHNVHNMSENTRSGDHQSETSTHEPRLFTLRGNGSSLKIPGKLAKLVKMNNSLRQQCSAARLIKRVSHSDSGQQFVEKLQGEWTISQELWTRVRAFTCWRAHSNLLKMFDDLELDKLTAQCPYGVLYRAKRTLEFILSMFASLQAETDYLAEVQFRTLDVPSPPGVTSTSSPDTDMTSLVFSDLPADEHLTKDVDLLQYLNGCQEWTSLKFTETFLQVQKLLLQLVRTEWWRELSTDSRDPSVLQNLSSLVSSGGQFLPTFVTNNQL